MKENIIALAVMLAQLSLTFPLSIALSVKHTQQFLLLRDILKGRRDYSFPKNLHCMAKKTKKL